MIELSIVIPAFNEARRLPPYLRQIAAYIGAAQLQCEVIVVNDGSSDGLTEVLRTVQPPMAGLVVIEHEKNLGKGAAIATGVRHCQGNLILFADADGATPIDQEEGLRKAVREGADLAIGSRRLSPRLCARTGTRRVAAAAFSWAVRAILGLDYSDTQCGFKMFRSSAATTLCGLAREQGYLFDVEVLWWADRLGYRVQEVAVAWTECPHGQVNVLRDGPRMLLGLCRLRSKLPGRTAQPQAPHFLSTAKTRQDKLPAAERLDSEDHFGTIEV